MTPIEHEPGSVELRLPSGEHHTLFHGDLIGRLWSAALRLDDARISEAHAMISNRGREMKLLALRGRFMVGGQTSTDIALRTGMRITLAPGLEVDVVSVSLPAAVLFVAAEGLAPRAVPGVLSLYGGVAPRIRSGWRPDAHGWLWPTGEGWMRSADPPAPVIDGDTWELEGARFRVHLERSDPGTAPTQRGVALGQPLRVVARYDSVHLLRDGQPVVAISGRSARLVSELAVLGQPCSWEVLAVELWGDLDRTQLRRRWDMQLQRLRQKLRSAAIRTDLVRATGNGLIELVLGPDDVVVDET
ncbi:MAG: hypothetical protein R3F61_23700 [Myxococcota bacterium]